MSCTSTLFLLSFPVDQKPIPWNTRAVPSTDSLKKPYSSMADLKPAIKTVSLVFCPRTPSLTVLAATILTRHDLEFTFWYCLPFSYLVFSEGVNFEDERRVCLFVCLLLFWCVFHVLPSSRMQISSCAGWQAWPHNSIHNRVKVANNKRTSFSSFISFSSFFYFSSFSSSFSSFFLQA